MMTSRTVLGASFIALAAAFVPAAARVTASSEQAPAYTPSVEHGAYMVNTKGCHDCHTPWVMGPKGPEPDMTRALTGHPSDLELPAPPELPPGPWAWVAAATNTAFAGPWGVSFTANLTPDTETGLGDWTEEMFIRTMRTGLHQGKGRPVLPPMPWSVYGQLTDNDLKDLFAYLRSLKPVRNRVPAPVDPGEMPR
ncbi:MAG: c-type cytochrome [Acidobacteria bacterium]|nr:c-type cytochrome [Acidobacteriota bacterium]